MENVWKKHMTKEDRHEIYFVILLDFKFDTIS